MCGCESPAGPESGHPKVVIRDNLPATDRSGQMTDTHRELKIMNRFASVAFCGIAIGWLMGLSASPVVESVIAALLAVLVGYLTLKSGEETRPLSLHKVNLLFGALLGVVAGSVLGVYARTHDWLGYDTRAAEANFWSLHTGLPEQAIYQKMLEHQYTREGGGTPINQGVLFSTPTPDECKSLRKARGDDLVRNVGAVANKKIAGLAERVSAPGLEYLVDNVLCPQ